MDSLYPRVPRNLNTKKKKEKNKKKNKKKNKYAQI